MEKELQSSDYVDLTRVTIPGRFQSPAGGRGKAFVG